MAEQKADTSKPQQPSKPMEDDDEFEEFDVEGSASLPFVLAAQAFNSCKRAMLLCQQSGEKRRRTLPKQSSGKRTGTIQVSVTISHNN